MNNNQILQSISKLVQSCQLTVRVVELQLYAPKGAVLAKKGNIETSA